MVPFAGWEMPVQYPAGILAEHHAVRERRRHLRRLPHGRVRDHRPRPQRLRQPRHHQRRRTARAGPGAVLGAAHARGHLRRRLHRLPLRRQADDRGQRVQHRARRGSTSSTRRAASTSGSRTSPPRSASSPCRARAPSRSCSRWPTSRSARSPTTTSRGRQDRRGAVLHLPHRLHRRGRLRALLPRARHRRRCGTRSRRPAPSRSASARATRSGSRWATRSTATRSTTPSRRSRPGSAGS